MSRMKVIEKAPPMSRAGFTELGHTGLKVSGGLVREEFLKELTGPKAIKAFREMSSNDPIIGAFLFAVEQIMRQVDWKVITPGTKPQKNRAQPTQKKIAPPTAESNDLADFIDSCRDDMSLTWGDTIVEALSFLVYGWALHEIVYKRRMGPDQRDSAKKSKYTDGRIGWRKLPLRSQDSLDKWEYAPAPDLSLLGMHQRTNEKGNVLIPIENALLFRTKVFKNNPEGVSILRNAYRPWYLKKRIEEVEGIGVERDLAGMPVLKTPEGQDLWNTDDPKAVAAKRDAEQILMNIRNDSLAGLLLPFGWEFELATSGGQRAFNTTEIINRYDQRIAMTVLADFILLGHGGKFGSFALAKAKTSAFTLSIVGYLNVIRDVFNSYAIPRLFAINGIQVDEPPKLDYTDIAVPDLRQLSAYITALTGAGVVLDDRQVIRQLLNMANLPADWTDLGGGGGTGNEGDWKPGGVRYEKPAAGASSGQVVDGQIISGGRKPKRPKSKVSA